MAINPLQTPINYAGMTPQINIGQQFSELGQVLLDRQKRTEAEEVKKTYATDLKNAIDNPTQDTWNQMIAKYPKQREAFAEVRKGYGDVAATNEFNQGFEVSMALENNNPVVAKQKLQEIITARTASKMPIGIYQQTFDALEAGNTKGAQAGVNYALSMADPDRFKKQVDARVAAGKAPSELIEAESKAAKAPFELSQAIAVADRAIAEATTAQATATNAPEKAAADALLARAQADKAGIEAQYAEGIAKDAVLKRAADLGLTNAQRGAALAQTRKLGIESQKAALELEALKATGGVDPAKAFEQEEKLRKEYQGRTKVYGELGSTFNNIQSSANANTGPGDIALITGFMKMLDPNSVVRETEFATARDTAGLFENLRNQAQKLQSGQLFSLDSKQRKEYVDLAKQYLDSAQKKAGEDKKALGVVVKNYKLNADNVFGPETVAPATPSPNSVRVGNQTYTRPANFTDAQWSAYKQSVGAAP